jgi:hypothetical protein
MVSPSPDKGFDDTVKTTLTTCILTQMTDFILDGGYLLFQPECLGWFNACCPMPRDFPKRGGQLARLLSGPYLRA